ncbi:chromosome segregation protein SMC [uncultured Shewanella sp.]|uniref:chromosome segregation protein SMC n=1 Tax=uncultured Shewanella sp. TaxID=173975 RepID=UPI002616EB2C|nr:chromosome segregation protein SMC [uncultured Shewanella sp.]
MRLKQIKLAGFKSFTDVTKIPFINPLTAVVGPNGCGKSNVIDAVRWVLGESSAKHLRGEAMTDVIFNGSSARRPVSVASVELSFENIEGRLSGEYASYQAIAVKRQVSREGDSSYFLNGQKCRRRDITDLFMGTGLGPRSYAIIEQGTISRLIESKPQELRVFIEEAAGISRYKERRRETENRMRHTRENLERLSDIRIELGKQLEKLSQQSKVALEYRELKQAERDQEAQLSVMRYQELQTQSDTLTSELSQVELNMAAESAKLQALELSLTQWQVTLSELDKEEQTQVEACYLGKNQINQLEQTLSHRQQQEQSFQSRLTELNASIARYQQKSQQDEQVHRQLTLTIAEHQAEHDNKQAQLSEHKAAHTQLNDKVFQLNEALKAQNERVSQLTLSFELASKQHGHHQVIYSQKQQQQEKTAQQIQRLQERLAQDSLPEFAQQLKDKQEIRKTCAALAQDLQEAFTSQKQTQGAIQAEKALLEQSLAEKQGRLSVVTRLLHTEESVVTEQALWQHLEVKAGWEQAVEWVFDGLLKMPTLVGAHQEGFTLHSGYKDEVVQAKVNLSPWLSHVHWVNDKAAALSLLPELSSDDMMVTADGFMIGQGFALKKISGDGDVAWVQLKREQSELTEHVAELKQGLIQIEQALQASQTALTALTDRQAENNDTLQACQLSIAALTSKMAEREEQTAHNKAQLEQLAQYSQSLYEEMALEQSAIDKLSFEYSELHDDLGIEQAKKQQLEDTRKVEQCQLNDKAALLAQAETDYQQALSQLQSLNTQLAVNQQKMDQHDVSIKELQMTKFSLEQAQFAQGESENVENTQELQSKLAKVLSEQALKEEKLTDIRAQQAHIQLSCDSVTEDKKQWLGKVNQLTQSSSSIKLRREGINGQIDSQLSLLKEQNIDVSSVMKNMDSQYSSHKRQKDLGVLRQRISALGAVNLAAIEEFEQQSERKKYLDSQDQDLHQALKSLEAAINKIDKETKIRFKETFDKVNQDLGLLFPKVFGGGSAYLALTDNDLLETGVTIMARPPGKKNSTIHLLSGGEKALTALSLVFAIFRLNPAPFCMLDEVDAPLDDANVERFCRLVKEMSQTVQFIYISHNKITMELADQLIGVTMHEPGVSRIVAVDIDEALAMADAE